MRTVTGHSNGWTLEIRADFSARELEGLRSGDGAAVIRAADSLAISHDVTGADGKPVASLMDGVPWDHVAALVTDAIEQIGKLPNP